MNDQIQTELFEIIPPEVRYCVVCNGEMVLGKKWNCPTCSSRRYQEHKKTFNGRSLTNHKDFLRKQEWVSVNGGCCNSCGYISKVEGCLSVYDFHHLDPDAKKFEINASYLRSISDGEVEAEIDKCILLCRNCHAEEHDLIKRQLITLEESIERLKKFKATAIAKKDDDKNPPTYTIKVEREPEVTFKQVVSTFNTLLKTWYKKIGNRISIPYRLGVRA